ncbi:MAG: ABC-F family ATP-binding cassette domain-containing protein [Gemmatimonadaceae bacterium]|nr:ABC-F family ATP-binding cassette domain-containing protein [Gemmatimonadaceae bacterium]
MTLISLNGVGVAYGATTILSNVSCVIAAGEKWGIIGRNGIGKTSLFKLLTGEMPPSAGSVARQPGLVVTLLEQHRDFGSATTVWDAAAAAFADLIALERSLAEQAEALAHTHDEAALAKYGRDLERFERQGGYEFHARVDAVLDGLGFDHEAAKTQTLASLSGGERGRVGLARQLAAPGDLLLLDEPTNHLDLDTSKWLEGYLRESPRAVVCISHDRAFLEAFVDHVLHVEGGTAFPYVGDYVQFVRQREERRLAQQRAFSQQSKKIAAEEDYIRRNIAGVNTAQAKGRRKRLERMPRLSAPIGEASIMALRLESGDRSGDQVAVLDHVTVAIGERTLVHDFSAVLQRGDVIALVGPNGAGKSTLIKTILGERPPAAGEVRLGPSTHTAWYRQDLAHLPLTHTVVQCIEDARPLWERRLVQGHLGRFDFGGDESERVIGTLSGGERARVALALLTLERSNLLVMDEPTNHLDIESIEALEDALGDYDGSVLLVSHDRAVLRGLATRVWAIHEGRVIDYPGSFVEWEEDGAAWIARTAASRAPAKKPAAPSAPSTATPDDRKAAQRDERAQKRAREQAEREAAAREAEVQRLEEAIAALQETLHDDALYTTPEGTARAQALGRELAERQSALDLAMDAWTQAAARAEALTREG